MHVAPLGLSLPAGAGSIDGAWEHRGVLTGVSRASQSASLIQGASWGTNSISRALQGTSSIYITCRHGPDARLGLGEPTLHDLIVHLASSITYKAPLHVQGLHHFSIPFTSDIQILATCFKVSTSQYVLFLIPQIL